MGLYMRDRASVQSFMTIPVIITGEAGKNMNSNYFCVHYASLGTYVFFPLQIFNHFSNEKGNLPQTQFASITARLFLSKYIYKAYMDTHTHNHINTHPYTKQSFEYVGELIQKKRKKRKAYTKARTSPSRKEILT